VAEGIQSFQQLWQQLGLVQRVLLVGILLACVGAAALLVGWARKPNMAMLYSGLSPDEAAKIVEKVRDAGLPYELTAGGSTIMVPAEEVYSLRLTMASAGLPVGQGKGYRILDEAKIGTSPFRERVNFVRAVEGELAKSIQLIDGVQLARVHIVKPESMVFAKQDKNASATVVLRMRAGWRLTPSNIASIVHLVAGGVEGLVPEKVVVVDSRGKLLSDAGGNELASKDGTFLDYKSRVEEYLSGKAEDMLAAALGPHRASVRVDAVIDTSRVSETTETYDPEKKVVTREETKSKSSVPVANTGGAATGTKTTDENITSEYLVSRVVQEKTDLPGKIKSLSVAAFVDLSAPETSEGDKSAAPAATLTVKDVEDIIRNAVGLKATDTLKVVETKFPQAEIAQALELETEGGGWMSSDFLLEMARRFSLGVLVIGALVALRIVRGPKKVPAEAMTGQAALGLEAQGMDNKQLTAGTMPAQPELLRAQITSALHENPEEVKRLFLKWVESEKGGS